MYIEEYTTYQESEVLALYGSVGWTAYTEQPEALRRGFAGSLLTDDTEKTKGFYRSLGLLTLPELGCCGFMRP